MKNILFLLLLCLFGNVSWSREGRQLVQTRQDYQPSQPTIYRPGKGIYEKGVVLLIPGTDGIGDIPFSKFKNLSPKLLRRPHPLSRIINEEGFIFVTLNTRGIKPIKKCLKNTPVHEFKNVFPSRCINKDLRSKISWDLIEKDIETASLQIKRRFRKNRFGYLAVSEGGMHISRLIRQNRIAPDFVIGFGVPTSSPLENTRHQLTSAGYIRRILKTMDERQTEELGFSELETLFPDMLSLHKNYLKSQSSGDVFQKAELVERLQKNLAAFEQTKREILNLERNDAVSADMDGIEIPSFSSVKWWQDSLSDEVSLCESLKRFKGSVHLFYGEFDLQVGRDDSCEAQTSALSLPKFQIHQIENLGHSLMDDSGRFTNELIHSLRTILRNER